MEAEGAMTDTQRFDQEAGTWDDDPGRVALARAVADAIRGQVGLSASMDVLDFGSGTGLLATAVQPDVRSVTAADTSAGMLDVLERKVRALGLSSIRPYRLDAVQSIEAAGEFDLIISSMTLHHVRDLDGLFSQFKKMLRDGGHVALADLDVEDGTFHSPDVTDVHHLGFDRAALVARLAAAGFEGLQDTTAFIHRKHGREYPVFLVSGRAVSPSR
jgi:2-polyprenyl-3-methyl-5-hydroxy-6-metoxy-1,4-benzoquinol methylase